MHRLDITYRYSCKSSYESQPSCKLSSKSIDQFMKSYAYKVLTCKNLKLDNPLLQALNKGHIP